MKITAVTGPGAVQDLSTPEHVRSAQMQAKIAKFTDANTQQQPPVNPNAISAEELGAVKSPTLEGKNDSSAPVEEAEVPAEPKDPETERKFAQIARQEKALRAKIHQANLQLKQREEALKAREAALQPQLQQQDLSNYIDKARIKQDALTVLEEAGVSWDELTNQAVNRQPTDPRVMSTISQLQAEIAQLKAESKTTAKTMEEREAANYQAAVKQIRSDVNKLVYTDPEFETIKAMKAEKDVVELITKTYAERGEVLTAEEAAQEVEAYLIEEGMKITQLAKIKKRMAAANASQLKPDEKTQTQKQPQPMKTLTNATASAQKTSVRERAIARANGFTGDF